MECGDPSPLWMAALPLLIDLRRRSLTTPQPQEILEAALGLPDDDRFQLVAQLLESFRNDSFGASLDDPDLPEELDRRFADTEGAVSVSGQWDTN